MALAFAPLISRFDRHPMLLISCPVCLFRGNETAFHYGGEAHIRRPASHQTDISDAEHEAYLFRRRNPRGIAHELWLCRACGKWFNAVRDTLALDIKATYPIDADPPADWPLDKISETI